MVIGAASTPFPCLFGLNSRRKTAAMRHLVRGWIGTRRAVNLPQSLFQPFANANFNFSACLMGNSGGIKKLGEGGVRMVWEEESETLLAAPSAKFTEVVTEPSRTFRRAS